MSTQTKLYTCRPVNVNKPEEKWVYVTPSGDVSTPCTHSYAQARCDELNILVRAGNTISQNSDEKLALKSALSDLVDIIESCSNNNSEQLINAIKEAKRVLKR